jgi:hypothetical protein
MLRLELGELSLGGFDLSLTGFGELEIKALLADKTEGRTDPDNTPDPPAHPVSQLGELWLLGRHRLLCGDSTVATDVERVLAGVTPHLMVTDPPYGVNYDPDWRNAAKFGDGKSHSGRASGKVVNDNRADWREAWALFPGDVAYIWHGGVHAGEVQTSLEVCGFAVRSQIIWAKSQLVISRGHYHAQHEPCFYAVRDGRTGHWTGDRTGRVVCGIEIALDRLLRRRRGKALAGFHRPAGGARRRRPKFRRRRRPAAEGRGPSLDHMSA